MMIKLQINVSDRWLPGPLHNKSKIYESLKFKVQHCAKS